jgi:hypothetical protein
VDQPALLDVTPTAGGSSGPGDAETITVFTRTAGLPIGTHMAAITINDPAAANSPVIR